MCLCSLSAVQWARAIAAAALVFVNAIAAANWEAKHALDPFTSKARCVVESVRKTLHDGYGDTEVLLQVDRKSLLVKTRSNLDDGKGDITLSIDKQEPLRMDKIYLDQSAVFDSDIGTIVQQFKKGLQATLRLRFWPTYPDTGIKTVSFSLIGFTKAYEEFENCQ
jgi:hypothetical protein